MIVDADWRSAGLRFDRESNGDGGRGHPLTDRNQDAYFTGLIRTNFNQWIGADKGRTADHIDVGLRKPGDLEHEASPLQALIEDAHGVSVAEGSVGQMHEQRIA